MALVMPNNSLKIGHNYIHALRKEKDQNGYQINK